MVVAHGPHPAATPHERSVMTIAARGSVLSLAAALAVMLLGAPAARAAATQVLAIEPDGITSTPVLWNGGVAWSNHQGIYAATASGSTPQRLAKIPVYDGFLIGYKLDSGSGTPNPSGDLAFGYLEENNQTPPMGPGDTSVPTPPIPYGDDVQNAGVITGAGQETNLPVCPTADPFVMGNPDSYAELSFDVSLSGATVAYGCPFSSTPGFLALANPAAPAVTGPMLPGLGNLFQLSGQYLVADTATAATAGVVEVDYLTTSTMTQLFTVAAAQDPVALALQSDGTLVVVGPPGATACAPGGTSKSGQPLIAAWPTEWFAPGDPTPHQLGCFYSGVPRPVGGEWIGLTPTAGGGAALESVELATGTTRTLEVFPNPEMFMGADFDGQSLAWAEDTCAGTQIKLTADVAAITPDPAPPTTCPVTFHAPATLHPKANGRVAFHVTCTLGCSVILAVNGRGPLYSPYQSGFALPPGSSAVAESFRLDRRQLRYLRKHGRQKVTLTAQQYGPGSAYSASHVHVTLVP